MQYKRNFFVFLLLLLVPASLFARTQIDCKVHIDISQKHTEKITIHFSHDKQCELVMNPDRSEVIVRQKNTLKPVMSYNVEKDYNIVAKVIQTAKSKLGSEYAYAQAGPDRFDCSGFVYYVFTSNHISIPRTSINQSKSGKKILQKNLQVGDILFFDTANRKHVNHSGIYLGNGKFIHASSGKAHSVVISDFNKGFYKDKFLWGVRKR